VAHQVKVRILRPYTAEISTFKESIDVKPGDEREFPIEVARMLIHDSVAQFVDVVDPGPGADGLPRISAAEKAKCKEIMDEATKKAVDMRKAEGLTELAKLSAEPPKAEPKSTTTKAGG
jgi:hypothetical protein